MIVTPDRHQGESMASAGRRQASFFSILPGVVLAVLLAGGFDSTLWSLIRQVSVLAVAEVLVVGGLVFAVAWYCGRRWAVLGRSLIELAAPNPAVRAGSVIVQESWFSRLLNTLAGLTIFIMAAMAHESIVRQGAWWQVALKTMAALLFYAAMNLPMVLVLFAALMEPWLTYVYHRQGLDQAKIQHILLIGVVVVGLYVVRTMDADKAKPQRLQE